VFDIANRHSDRLMLHEANKTRQCMKELLT
jgi:hypothetical protein